MRTPITPENVEFSQEAHKAAQRQLYPNLFNTTPDKIVYEDVTLSEDPRHQILDGEMAVDRMINVSISSLRAPITFTVQERFRRTKFQHYQDITVTEFNLNSGRKSELYKLSGGLFVYGYFNNLTNLILQAVVFSSSALLLSFVRGNLNDWNVLTNKKNQTFFTFKFNILRKAGLIIYEQ